MNVALILSFSHKWEKGLSYPEYPSPLGERLGEGVT